MPGRGSALFIPNPMVNFARPSYSCWLPGTQQTFCTRASGVIDPSDIPSPPSFCCSLSDLGNRLSSIARDVEELTIGQPQTSQGINVSTQTSGSIRVTWKVLMSWSLIFAFWFVSRRQFFPPCVENRVRTKRQFIL